MIATLKKVNWDENGIHIEVEFAPSAGESFDVFSKFNHFDSSSFNQTNVEKWIDSLLDELKSQMTKAEDSKLWNAYSKEV